MKRAHSLAALFLCIALVLSGCASEKDEALSVSAEPEICTGEGTFSDAGSLTSAQQQIILDYENAYFTSIGNFDIQMPEKLFCDETEKDVEKAIWNSTIAVRKAALEDLRLKSYTFKLTVTDTGEPGDLITMGTSSYTRHITEICALVTDENGNTVDYLLCSNTADLKNFPAGAYYLTNQQVIRISGWND